MSGFASIRALTFDCYGTLIDWETGLLRVLRPWAGPGRADDELLALFGGLETVVQRQHPAMLYRDVLAEVGRRLCAAQNRPADEAFAGALARSIGDWPAFSDTPHALASLARRAMLAVVSNVDHQSFELTRPKLGAPLAFLVAAQDVGAYKPDPAPLQRALAILARRAIGPHEVLHVAQSLYHDHVPAKALGLRTVYINRRAGRSGWGATPAPEAPVIPDFEFSSLAAFAGTFCSEPRPHDP